MNRQLKKALATLARAVPAIAAGSCLAAHAAPVANPYARLAETNVFRLQPASSIRTKPQIPARREMPRVFITGLAEVQGVPLALLEILEPGRPVQRQTLAVGASWQFLQILEINVVAGQVRLRLDGDEQILSLSTRG